MRRPDWWEWEIEITPYAEMRMEQRGISELELRAMLDRAHTHRWGPAPGRWTIMATHRRQPWIVVVEPDETAQRVVVITVYPAGG